MKNRKHNYTCFLFILAIFIGSCNRNIHQSALPIKDNIKLGAYYFDGWTGKTFHISPALDSFPERKPVWGWVTSTPSAITEQIDLAADAGISFFSFCWYYNKADGDDPNNDILNHALQLYQQSANKNRLGFSIMVANHEGYFIGPEEWPVVSKAWIKLFADPSYVQVDQKPIISFFSLNGLLKSFGSERAVHTAFDSLRAEALRAGLNGVTIALTTGEGRKHARQAKRCGFNVLTSYNDHTAGFKQNSPGYTIDNLIRGTGKVWKQFKKYSLPYIPVATLGWDPRPSYPTPPDRYYTGYSSESVYQSTTAAINWVRSNPRHTTREQIVMLYAWNEYGEGAWLTPSASLQDSLLMGVKRAVSR